VLRLPSWSAIALPERVVFGMLPAALFALLPNC
jgi:hypothetical protein